MYLRILVGVTTFHCQLQHVTEPGPYSTIVNVDCDVDRTDCYDHATKIKRTTINHIFLYDFPYFLFFSFFQFQNPQDEINRKQ